MTEELGIPDFSVSIKNHNLPLSSCLLAQLVYYVESLHPLASRAVPSTPRDIIKETLFIINHYSLQYKT